MAIKQRFRIAVIAAVCAIAGSYVALHPAWRYDGGVIYDNGVVSYPRFIARFRSVPFNAAGEYAFQFRHFPGSPAVVMLNTPTSPPYEPLENLTTRIELTVKDQRGRIVCQGGGFPAGKGTEQFMVTSGPRRAIGLWHSGCNGVPVKACSPCTLTVRISAVDPATPTIPLVPTLEGGGIELP